jgi:thiol-disulfide isomerase/thioredoxin
MKKNFVLIMFVVIALLASTGCASSLVGKAAPEINVRQWMTSTPPVLKNLTGKVYAVEFWATWCHPCIEGIPHLVDIKNKYKNSNFELIAICADKSPEKIQSLIRSKKINYSVAIDNGSADFFKIKYYPTAVVVDHNGIVTWMGRPKSKNFEKAIDKALAAAGPAFLSGIKFGPYENFKPHLQGGANFATAYNNIMADTIRGSKNASTAKKIISTINKRINSKLSAAAKLRKTNPAAAKRMYNNILQAYSGIAIIENAKVKLARLGK